MVIISLKTELYLNSCDRSETKCWGCSTPHHKLPFFHITMPTPSVLFPFEHSRTDASSLDGT